MNQFALPSKGNLQTVMFWIGMYFISLAFAVFIGLSIFYSVKSKDLEFNKKKSAQQQVTRGTQANFVNLK